MTLYRAREADMSCSFCEAPERRLWAPDSQQDRLERIHLGNWMTLDRCPECEQLWCRVPHEPYGAFWYAVPWQYSPKDWRRLHDLDDGKTLHKWHVARVQELAAFLDSADQSTVAHHRRRSYGRNPVDESPEERPDLQALLSAV